MGVVVEGASDEYVETAVGRFASSGHQVGPRDGAELGTDEDGGAFWIAGIGGVFRIAAFGADPIAWPRGDGRERDFAFFVGLLGRRRF